MLISSCVCINSSLGWSGDINVDNSIKMVFKVLRLDEISEEANVGREESQKLS